ncbi:tetrapyrrole methylase [Cladochytrium replicatum]|nr:tetrapyrrole methylase [Cladochytrium replicatum]
MTSTLLAQGEMAIALHGGCVQDIDLEALSRKVAEAAERILDAAREAIAALHSVSNPHCRSALSFLDRAEQFWDASPEKIKVGAPSTGDTTDTEDDSESETVCSSVVDVPSARLSTNSAEHKFSENFEQMTSLPDERADACQLGTLTLVGAGPGDPSHLTLAAISAFQKAQLIISDVLVHPSIRKLIPPSTPILSAPKRKGRAEEAQREINKWIVNGVLEGKEVLRIKGGDPFVFGRGGEEVHALWSGIRSHLTSVNLEPPSATTLRRVVRVIPGLSSALVAPLAAGIPLTHRGVADQFFVATGRRESEWDEPEFPPYAPHRTGVFLMAMGCIARVQKALIDCGYPPTTAVVIVEKATWSENQRVVEGKLAGLEKLVKEAGIAMHATLIVGEVVNVLRDILDRTYEDRNDQEYFGGCMNSLEEVLVDVLKASRNLN